MTRFYSQNNPPAFVLLFLFLLIYLLDLPRRLYFELPALMPLSLLGVALIKGLIDSSVIGFISYTLLEVVKPLKARQERERGFQPLFHEKEGGGKNPQLTCS